MPSPQHEMPLEFLRNRPELAARLLESFDLEVPDHDRAELSAAECTDIQPKDYRADAVVTFSRVGTVRMAVVVEIQLKPSLRKRYSWPVYAATVRARLECPTVLLVICADNATAPWAAEPIPLGNPDSYLVPLVLGPDQVPVVTSGGGAGDAGDRRALGRGARRTEHEDAAGLCGGAGEAAG